MGRASVVHLVHQPAAAVHDPLVGATRGLGAALGLQQRGPMVMSIELVLLLAVAILAAVVAGMIVVLARLVRQFESAHRGAMGAATGRMFRAMIDSALDAIVLADAEGRISYVNPKTEQMFGWSRPELFGKSLTTLVPERFRRRHRESFQRFLEEGDTNLVGETVELTGVRRDGTEIPVELSMATWLDENGQPAFSGIMRDITDRRRTEQEARLARAAAEKANRAKSEFLANMSHEIRTPMNGIIGMSELLLGLPLDDQARDYAATIRQSGEILLRLLNDILDLSRLEIGRVELEEESFSLRELLDDTLHALMVHATEKGLELVVDVPPEVPDGLVGDPGRLRQILVNLIGNAIKYTDRGQVVVRVAVDELVGDTGTLRFEVHDTGIGIEKAYQARIFRAFEQGDPAIVRARGGTGLGLTISNQLVAMMGGQLDCESEPGDGSTFRFTARFGIRDVPALTAPAAFHDLRVLIADDNRANRRAIHTLLTDWGMRVDTAHDGNTAFEAVKRAASEQTPYAIALVDGLMPDMTGLELVRRIRQDQRLDATRLILLSPAGARYELARARDLGVVSQLAKPIGQRELLKALQEAMGLRVTQVEPPRAEAIGRGLRLLVAEDDPVNQKVAARLLERRGHHVTLVSDGEAALERLATGEFDVALMDVRMPRLDGLAATRELRRREQAQGGHMPIIAMTAYAMRGDREECLAAGMDAYISKPMDATELYDVVEHAARLKRAPPGTTMSAVPATPVDWSEALARMGGSFDILRAVAAEFRDHAGDMRRRVARAVEARDANALRDAAHQLKGAASSLGATKAAEVALRLERMGANGDLSGATQAWRELDPILDEVEAEVRQRLRGPAEIGAPIPS